jgi:hypothetical protein
MAQHRKAGFGPLFFAWRYTAIRFRQRHQNGALLNIL